MPAFQRMNPTGSKLEHYVEYLTYIEAGEKQGTFSYEQWLKCVKQENEMQTKSQVKHTPGPWIVGMKGEFGTFNPNQIFAEDGDTIAQVYEIPLHTRLEEIEHSGTWDRGLANARLIAAAPKLLEALKLVQFGFSNNRCGVCAGWNMSPNGETDYAHTKDCKVGQAIAEAEGR